jgi:hypothetical protein
MKLAVVCLHDKSQVIGLKIIIKLRLRVESRIPRHHTQGTLSNFFGILSSSLLASSCARADRLPYFCSDAGNADPLDAKCILRVQNSHTSTTLAVIRFVVCSSVFETRMCARLVTPRFVGAWSHGWILVLCQCLFFPVPACLATMPCDSLPFAIRPDSCTFDCA